MRRRSVRKPAVTLSMFPFLAVLVCTMGALIVLLVCVLQKARIDAAAAAELPSATADEEPLELLQLDKADQEWRRGELERQRTEFQQELTRRRLTLSHFEDHIRQLEEQWQQLSSQAEELQRLGKKQESGSGQTDERLRALLAELETQRQRLADVQTQAAGKKRAFAIIPYEGPNGTKRRPIYIECTDEGIVLQPEGIQLSPADFEGSLGPGNPLDAALRTTREYLARYGETNSQGEPYPLLIVRPNGTMAYAAARAALKSWDDEFGYELIESDLQLAYPKPDPALASELARSIQDARQRQQILATIMPGRYKQSGVTGLVATTNGGFTALGSGATAHSTASTGGGASSGDGATFTQTFRDASLARDERVTSMRSAQRSSGSHAGPGGEHGSPPTATPGQPGSPIAGNSPGGGNSFPSGQASPTGQTGQTGQTGSSQSMPSTGVGDFAVPREDRELPNQAGKPARSSPVSRGMKPVAHSRGADWGLPNRATTATGIHRYVQVDCQPDRLLLLPDRADHRSPVVIPLPGETAAAIDPFIAALWKRMEQWGIAADGCYWKPVLRFHVRPDAEQRFVEFANLLEHSGLVVERKN